MENPNSFTFKDWQVYLSENVQSYADRQLLEVYVEKLFSNQTVVILNFHHLAHLLGINSRTLSIVLRNIDNYYHKFEIKKRKGGKRVIVSPSPILIEVQNWILKEILEKIDLHEACIGYVKGKNVIDNAKPHLQSKYIAKIDIEEFFPSIRINRIISIFKHLGYTNKISYYLAKLCSYENRLPQGACTSPTISNIVAKRLDARLAGLADAFNLNYSRYADDLTFSGDMLPYKIVDYINDILLSEKFKINHSKTKLLGKYSQKIR